MIGRAVAAIVLGLGAPASSLEIGPNLAEVRTFAVTEGERLWAGYGDAPFGFLLLEPERETSICRNFPPDGFLAAAVDPATGCARFTRPRGTLPAALLAALPLFGPPSVIVMGTPEATGRSPADWKRTILHEHFHQWQNALPGYYARVGALDLADGNQTGMWMLNFAFPYADRRVAAVYARAAGALADAVDSRGTKGFRRAFDQYLAARAAFERSVDARAWRYLEFQLWQEGVARWTEIALGRKYPDAAVRFETQSLEAHTLAALRKPDIATRKREIVYPYGAAEAMLMEACDPDWRAQYPAHLSMRQLLRAARHRCRFQT